MAAPGKSSSASTSASSRWGSFLSSAVTSVESRLDTILSEAGDEPHQVRRQAPQTTRSPSPDIAGIHSKPSSNSRQNANDRLQARLAKAMAGKHSPSGQSPRASVEVSRPSTELSAPSIDNKEGQMVVGEPNSTLTAVSPKDESTVTKTGGSLAETTTAEEEHVSEAADPNPSPPRGFSDEEAHIEDSSRACPTSHTSQNQTTGPVTIQMPVDEVSQLGDHISELKKRQDYELREHVERIDSMQSKLQYLAANAAESAKMTASEVPPGSLQRKLAEKDEKIALLMQEGIKLSNNEQVLRNTIKKLRLQATESQKFVETLKQSQDRTNREYEALRNRIQGEEDEQRREQMRQAKKDLEYAIQVLKRNEMEKDETIRRLKLAAKTTEEQHATEMQQSKTNARASEQEKQKRHDDELNVMKTEKQVEVEAARQEALDLQAKLDRVTNRAQVTEAETKHEVALLEGKLEAMRVAAEEVASGSAGEAQLKMLRQIEILQSQYASASDNWQSIEASLLAKVSSLAREKDEAQRRESEMRKKAREASSRTKCLEEELQDLRPSLKHTEEELESYRAQLVSSKTACKSAESTLAQTRAELEKSQQLVQERASSRSSNQAYSPGIPQQQHAPPPPLLWREGAGEARPTVERAASAESLPGSPLLSVPRNLSSDFMGNSGSIRLRRSPRPGFAAISTQDTLSEGLGLGVGRRLSNQPPSSRRSFPMNAPHSGSPVDSPDMPPAMTEHEPSIADTGHLSSGDVGQDMLSISTVAAGPSVQLVERMSAAIRRLEAEKVAAKEEMARVCSQREEARLEVLELMKDIEAAKNASERVRELEIDLGNVNARYQTTLEMLGEKSELVEELKADVQDIKAMYRELVEDTMKMSS